MTPIELAELVIDVIASELPKYGKLERNILKNRLLALFEPEQQPQQQPTDLTPMPDKEALAFGNELFETRDQYLFTPFKLIPLKALAKEADRLREQWRQITRYLRNKQVARQLEKESESCEF